MSLSFTIKCLEGMIDQTVRTIEFYQKDMEKLLYDFNYLKENIVQKQDYIKRLKIEIEEYKKAIEILKGNNT